MDYSLLTVVMPTLNEAGCVGLMIDALRERYPGIRLRIVDDGSVDGTPQVVAQRLTPAGDLVFHDRAGAAVKGLTASVLEGLEQVETPYFLVMDADFQHPPEVVGAMAEQMALGYPLVLGVRDNVAFRWTFSRLALQRLAAFFSGLRLLFHGVQARDPMSGFFGGDTTFVRGVIGRHRRRFVLRGYKVLFDLLKSLPPEAEITGVCYAFHRRGGGRPK
ncbi:MAG: glycosyltransferase [Magnetococcales bacterium]|nr:glycosyltransferase [Magnetococcales bacterium]